MSNIALSPRIVRDDQLRTALAEFVEVFDNRITADGVGGHLTCGEAEALAALLSASGAEHAARHWLGAHATGDDEESAEHHGPTYETAHLPLPTRPLTTTWPVRVRAALRTTIARVGQRR